MRITEGQLMTQKSAADAQASRRATGALMFAGALLLAPAMFSERANAQALGYAPSPQSCFSVGRCHGRAGRSAR